MFVHAATAIHASVETGGSGRHHATPTAATAAIDAAAGTAGGTSTSTNTGTSLVRLAAAATTANKLLAKSSLASRLLDRRGRIHAIACIAAATASGGRIIKFKPWRWIGEVKD